jgi:dethiobiotin synthetase
VIRYFVTGTDTNVGKTFVSCALARRARARGHKVFAFKPFETGCLLSDGQYVGADQEILVAATGSWQRGPLRGLYRFPLPAAPLVAAEAAGTAVDLAFVVHTIRGAISEHDPRLTLVEAAGGWRVPLTREADTATLAQALGFPVVVVARAGLGTINHSLLTIEAVERDGLSVAAVVLSQRPEDEAGFTTRNRDEIARRWAGLVMILGSDEGPLDRLLPV